MTPRQRQAANFKAPITKKREIDRLFVTPNLLGLHIPEEIKNTPRSDGLWRLAETSLTFIVGLGGYRPREQQWLGRFDGSRVKVDLICSLLGKEDIAISCKWLREPGSWDEKVNSEREKLNEILPYDECLRAYIVLTGPGWHKVKKARWTSGIKDTNRVRIVDVDFFMSAVWCQEL